MLHQDATDLYDLPEAGRLLRTDPVRLAREARAGRIPATRVGPLLALPAPWVDAAAGIAPVDEEGVREYWLARLSPPSPGARRPVRTRDRLPATDLLAPAEAARGVFADVAALVRLDADGTLPALRVDGEVRYDATLVDLVAREHEGEEASRAAGERRAVVREWSRFEYVAGVPPATPAPPSPPSPPSLPEPEAEGLKAFEIPQDLLPAEGASEGTPETPPPSRRLIRTEGFEVADED